MVHGSALSEVKDAENACSGASVIASISNQFVSIFRIVMIFSGNPVIYRPSGVFH